MFVASAPGVNFINILHTTLVPIFLHQKLQSQNVTREKLCKALLFQKFVGKMLMKLTTGVNSKSFILPIN